MRLDAVIEDGEGVADFDSPGGVGVRVDAVDDVGGFVVVRWVEFVPDAESRRGFDAQVWCGAIGEAFIGKAGFFGGVECECVIWGDELDHRDGSDGFEAI